MNSKSSVAFAKNFAFIFPTIKINQTKIKFERKRNKIKIAKLLNLGYVFFFRKIQTSVINAKCKQTEM